MKTMIITGASRGIGAATAQLAARNGFSILVNYLKNEAAARQVVDAIRSEGGTAEAVQADVTREEEIIRLFSECDRIFGRPDCLVNNAGILQKQSRVQDMDMERLNRIFTANIAGPFICAREAIKRMSTKHGGNGGTIVNVSSGAARTGSANEYVDYAASKGAIDTFTIGLAKELADEGIRVNGVRPATIYTGIHADGGEPGRVDRVAPTLPMKRGGRPDEVAEAILWLASDRSSFSTGIFIDVTGGR